ncbi:hypothetical protein [Methylotuvimicrobium buryatense]|uniref:hypothetical protein n=1 Tax=Methylotuvimicrobium buryatense TaxID=95641 RepID=UPI0003477BCE|nr:hypothetical protein [Methylotuvimicrobium buryatense]
MSKNEINRDDKYNRKLFYRVRTGYYIFNPNLALKVEGEWVNVYDLLLLDRLAPDYEHQHSGWGIKLDEIRAKNMENCKNQLRALLVNMMGG